MTTLAVHAHRRLKAELDDLIEGLSDEAWSAPSGCEGWRVRDVVAHLAASAKEVVEPTVLTPGDPPLPENRERQHDVFVDRRREWSVGEVADEYFKYTAMLAERVGGLQDEPLASQTILLPGLGTYPLHAIANALAFDYYCHLRLDILAPRGSVERSLPEPDHDMVYPAVEWMMWGLPQMQGADLDELVSTPITIRLTGPGHSTWTVTRPDPNAGLVVSEGDGGAVTVTSRGQDFIAWGTKRWPWRKHCVIAGDEALATPLLDALNII